MKIDPKQVAALYVRVSTEEQAKEGYSIQAQTEVLTQYCKLYNIKIHKIYRDLGLSGKNIKNRPALNELLNDASDNHFNCVIVWKISRLSRNLKDLLFLVDRLESNNVSFISYSEKFDTSVPVGRMTLQLLGSIAEFERNTIIENVKLGLEQRAREGKWTGNHVFGYDNMDKKIVINPKEAQIVERIYSMYLEENIGLRKIASILNNEGYRTKRDALFGNDYILRILKNPVYIGNVRHQLRTGKEYYEVKGIHEPIISEDKFNLVQDKLQKHSASWSRSANNFILVGLLKCRQCGSNLVSGYGRHRGKAYRYYKCGKYHRQGSIACSPNTVNADRIEDAVLNKVKEVVVNPIIISMVIKETKNKAPKENTLDNIKSEINRLNNSREKYFKLFENDKIPPEIFSGRLTEIQDRIEYLQLKKSSLKLNMSKNQEITEEEIVQYLKNIDKVFAQVSPEEKRKLLQDLIKSVNLDEKKSLKSVEFRFPV